MGGSQYQAKCLMEILIKKKSYEIYYVTRNSKPGFQAKDGYQLIDIGSSNFAKSYGFYFDFFKLKRALDAIQPDIIYQRVGGAYTGISAYYSKQNNCKMIWHIAHDSDVQPYFQQNLLRGKKFIDKKILEYGLRNATHIVAQTSNQADLLFQNYGRKAKCIVKNFHPFLEEKMAKTGVIKVIWVANLKKTKQPEIFLKLAQNIYQRGIKANFVMIGNESGEENWQRSFEKEVSSTPNLEYLGPKTIDEVNEILKTGHIFVNTSESEGFANTFIQSWFRQVPVLSLNCNPENIFDKNNIGKYSGNYQNMVEDVIELIKNNGLREKMGSDAKEYAMLNHSMQSSEQLIEILTSSHP
jgi:glycosyltransferase involved in cell wall biosynthesis